MLKIREIECQSETALSVYFYTGGNVAFEISLLADDLRGRLVGVMDVIACQCSLFIEFDVLRTSEDEIMGEVGEWLVGFKVNDLRLKNLGVVELPTYYHPDVAPDLVGLAREKNLSVDEVIRIHSETCYRVASLGFAPGFAYLSGMDSKIMSPRLSSPKRVARGSVGIADEQTAVYPAESPGGWVIVGNCPLLLFDVDADPVTPFQVGAEVRFVSITREEFLAIGGEL